MCFGKGSRRNSRNGFLVEVSVLVTFFGEKSFGLCVVVNMMLGFVGGIGGIVVDRRRVVVTAKGGGKKGGKSGDKNGVAKGAGVGFGVVKSEENAKRKVGEGLSVSPSTDGTELDVVDNRTEEEIMAAYGVYKSKGSDILQKRAEDRKRAKEQAEKNKVSNYDRFVKLVGPDGVGT